MKSHTRLTLLKSNRIKFEIEYSMVKQRESSGQELTKTDRKFLKSKKVKGYESQLEGGSQSGAGSAQAGSKGKGRARLGRAKGSNRGRGRGQGRGRSDNGNSSDGGSESDSSHEGGGLVGKSFEDEGQICTVTRLGYDSDDEPVVHYMFDGAEEFSSVAEVREWVEVHEISPSTSAQ